METKSYSIFVKPDSDIVRSMDGDRAVCYNGSAAFLKDIPDGAKFSFGLNVKHDYTKIGRGKTYTVLCVVTNCYSEESAKEIVRGKNKYNNNGWSEFSIAAVKEYREKEEA